MIGPASGSAHGKPTHCDAASVYAMQALRARRGAVLPQRGAVVEAVPLAIVVQGLADGAIAAAPRGLALAAVGVGRGAVAVAPAGRATRVRAARSVARGDVAVRRVAADSAACAVRGRVQRRLAAVGVGRALLAVTEAGVARVLARPGGARRRRAGHGVARGSALSAVGDGVRRTAAGLHGRIESRRRSRHRACRHPARRARPCQSGRRRRSRSARRTPTNRPGSTSRPGVDESPPDDTSGSTVVPSARPVDEVVEVGAVGLAEAPEPHAESDERKRHDRDAFACAVHQKVTRTPMARMPNHGIT